MGLNDKTTVLVTGVSQNSVGHQIVKSLLLYRDLYRIIGSNKNGARKSDYYIDAFETLPHSSKPDYIYKLIELCKKNNVSAIFPGSEEELILISREANLIEQNGIKPIILNYETVNLCLNKNSLTKAMEDLHIPHPSSIRIDSKTDLDSIELYPLVLKPERGSGSKGVIIVQSVKELKSLVPIWLENYGELVGQEYIESTSGEYTVGVITDTFDGLVRNSIIMKRSIMDGIGHGSKVVNKFRSKIKEPFLVLSSGISQGIFIEEKSISSQIETSILNLGVKGVVNVQCRIQDGVVKIFEINPRFSGTTFGRALCGYNEPHLLLQRILNEIPIQFRFPYQLGLYERSVQDNFYPL
jgi:carbamoyl-phosphate synthase large subunit